MFCCVHIKFKFQFKLYFIVVKFIFLVYSLLRSSLFELKSLSFQYFLLLGILQCLLESYLVRSVCNYSYLVVLLFILFLRFIVFLY